MADLAKRLEDFELLVLAKALRIEELRAFIEERDTRPSELRKGSYDHRRAAGDVYFYSEKMVQLIEDDDDPWTFWDTIVGRVYETRVDCLPGPSHQMVARAVAKDIGKTPWLRKRVEASVRKHLKGAINEVC